MNGTIIKEGKEHPKSVCMCKQMLETARIGWESNLNETFGFVFYYSLSTKAMSSVWSTSGACTTERVKQLAALLDLTCW